MLYNKESHNITYMYINSKNAHLVDWICTNVYFRTCLNKYKSTIFTLNAENKTNNNTNYFEDLFFKDRFTLTISGILIKTSFLSSITSFVAKFSKFPHITTILTGARVFQTSISTVIAACILTHFSEFPNWAISSQDT